MTTETLANASYLFKEDKTVEELTFISVAFKFKELMPIKKWVELIVINTGNEIIENLILTDVIGKHVFAVDVEIYSEINLAKKLAPLEQRIVSIPLFLDFFAVWAKVHFIRNGVTRSFKITVQNVPDDDDWDSHDIYNLLDYQKELSYPLTSKNIETDLGLKTCFKVLSGNIDLLKQTTPKRFEEVVAKIFSDNGFVAQHVGQSGDNGVDVIAIKENLISPINYLIQCKQTKNKVGISIIRELYGVKTDLKSSKAILVTTSSFTKGALQFAEKNTWEIGLIDFEKLKKLITT